MMSMWIAWRELHRHSMCVNVTRMSSIRWLWQRNPPLSTDGDSQTSHRTGCGRDRDPHPTRFHNCLSRLQSPDCRSCLLWRTGWTRSIRTSQSPGKTWTGMTPPFHKRDRWFWVGVRSKLRKRTHLCPESPAGSGCRFYPFPDTWFSGWIHVWRWNRSETRSNPQHGLANADTTVINKSIYTRRHWKKGEKRKRKKKTANVTI